MPFSEAQEVSIRAYLCFPLGFYDLNTRLESMLDKVGGNATEKAHVETILAKLVLVETAISSSGTSANAKGALKAVVGDAEWYDIKSEGGASTDPLTARSYGRVLINRLAACFGFATDELPANYFATGSSAGGHELRLG